MNKNKVMRIPYWLLKLLPMWDYICPKCRKEVKQKSHKCVHCGENYGTPIHIPPRMLKDPKVLEEYVHKHVFPRVSPLHRAYLTQFFTVLFAHGFEGGNFGNDPLTGYAWDGTVGLAAVTTNKPHHGTYNMETDNSINDCYAWEAIADAPELYVRMYIAFSAVPAANQSASFILLWNNDWGQRLADANISWDGANPIFKFVNWGLGGLFESITTDVIPVANTYYCFELRFKQNTLNGAQLWIDGILKATGTVTTFDGVVQEAWIGRDYFADFACIMYIDCVKFADVRINCEVSAPPKGTIAIHAKLAEII